ncbi:helix-turn-helix domain-containing protein [Glutamicibacter protophormiae]|uniref:DNA-binding IclR family transcriptional regulator n=1 Tax=Glutamicibacter protophormiae TaxID=37930 RepID=A0ABS4XL79_GLUPR|nr:helix-turn-helix domain-containing protein [Glutamicibacter protophormiae]MBP2397262.1 DNA-binding IclR family transcriptional regulator [Glutamicibacter protophormiae]GGL80618.1 transcriptional regulator [Glutamicibacter protophormiae]
MTEQKSDTASRTAGSQTLARGLLVLRLVAQASDGLAITDVALAAGVHRTVAYRVLNTLCDAHLLHRGADGRYRGAAGLLALAGAGYQHLRSVALPLLSSAATELGATVSLLVRESDMAVALAVVSPPSGSYHVMFAEGSRHPISRGAAGLALQAAGTASEFEPERIRQVRAAGYAQTFGEVEPNMHGLAVPIPLELQHSAACLNVITVRQEDLASVRILQEVAQHIANHVNG